MPRENVEQSPAFELEYGALRARGSNKQRKEQRKTKRKKEENPLF
jgi:hypothetical protein